MDRIHPSLWIFIRKMKDERSSIEASAAAAQNGNLAPQKAQVQANGKRSSDFGGNTATG